MPRPTSPAQRLQQLYTQRLAGYQQIKQQVADWLVLHSIDLSQLKENAQQTLAAVSLAGTLALQQPQMGVPQPDISLTRIPLVNAQVIDQVQQSLAPADATLVTQVSQEEHQSILTKMQEYVQQAPGHLQQQDELYLEQQLTDMLGFPVAAELEGNRLNHSIGIMGGEQHLKRFPTDSLDQHDAYRESGIAPNRGAFGWFTEQGELSQKAIEREKYYVAVQTLYLPNWNAEHPRLKEWYKFRKMVVINPAEKKAVVVVVGDAGPALWVKKQFGGSPEVIREGQIWSKSSRGRVLLLFVDDPTDTVALGPIDLDWSALQARQASQSAQSHAGNPSPSPSR